MVNQQLVEYIKSELSKGINEAEVKNVLTKAGWLIADIEEAMLVAKSNSAPLPPVSLSGSLNDNIYSRSEEMNSSLGAHASSPIGQSEESWFKNVTPKPKREKMVIIIAVSAFLLIAGGVFGYTYYSQIPDTVLKKMTVKMSSVKTMAFSGDVVADFEMNPQGVDVANMSNQVTVKMDGIIDATDEKSPNTEMKIDVITGIQGVSVIFNMEMKMIGQVMYLKVNDFPMLDLIGGGELRNKWYKLDVEAIADEYGIPDEIKEQLQSQNILNKLTTEQIKQINEMWDNEIISYAKNVVRMKNEKVNGVDSYHYEIPLDKDRISDLVMKTIDIMGTDVFSGEEREAMGEVMEIISSDKVNLWISKKDNLPTKVMFDIVMNLPEDSGKYRFNYTLFFKDYDKTVKVEAPSDSVPIETLLESLGIEPESPEAKTDKRAISVMNQIAVQAEILFVKDDSYVNLLCSDANVKPFCDEIDVMMGGYPLIRKPVGSRPTDYCAVIILKELSGLSKQYYCIDSLGASIKTTINPTNVYCTKTRFSCPPSSVY